MSTICKCAGAIIVGFVMTGCATHNYDFAAVINGPSRISHLVDDLARITDEEGTADEELYEFSLVPLVHSQLHVFAEVDEEDTPVAFIETDIDSRAPLFGFVSGTFRQYDEGRHLLSQHEFESNLWGAFRKHRELVGTRAGIREMTRHTFLWLFTWWGEERWHPAAEVAPESL